MSHTAHLSRTTTDQRFIRKWIEARDGIPCRVKNTDVNDKIGIIRIDFPQTGDDENLEEIPWEAFFEQFEASDLAFLYQELTDDGDVSYFNKFVERD